MAHVDLSKVFDQLRAKKKLWETKSRVGRVGYNRHTGTIDFYPNETANRTNYWIPFDELRTYEGQMRWVYQLRTKSWLTIEVLNDFLDCLDYLGVRPRT